MSAARYLGKARISHRMAGMADLGSHAKLASQRALEPIVKAKSSNAMLTQDCSLSLHHAKPADPALAPIRRGTAG